jgi:uncharacterized protein (DUF2141 family)
MGLALHHNLCARARRIGLAVSCGLMLCAAFGPARADDAPACDPANPSQVRLLVSVSGMRNADGLVTVTIYPDDAAHFLDGAYKLARQSAPVALPVTRFCFALPAPGYYAVALFHDENSNGHFDTTLLGIPAEGFGFSNNPTLYVGPPELAQARVALHAGDNPVSVQMKYY